MKSLLSGHRREKKLQKEQQQQQQAQLALQQAQQAQHIPRGVLRLRDALQGQTKYRKIKDLNSGKCFRTNRVQHTARERHHHRGSE